MEKLHEAIELLTTQLRVAKNESRVEITRNAKGRVDISVKVYLGNTSDEVAELSTLTQCTYDALNAKYAVED